MDNNDVHPEKALSSILVTRSGIRMEDKEEQLLNAYAPISVTLFGIWIEDNNEQPEKVWSLISVTELGILTEHKFVHPSKTPLPILTIFESFILHISVQYEKA